jgi:hypothetical protein
MKMAVFWGVAPCRPVRVYHTSLHGAAIQKTAILTVRLFVANYADVVVYSTAK